MCSHACIHACAASTLLQGRTFACTHGREHLLTGILLTCFAAGEARLLISSSYIREPHSGVLLPALLLALEGMQLDQFCTCSSDFLLPALQHQQRQGSRDSESRLNEAATRSVATAAHERSLQHSAQATLAVLGPPSQHAPPSHLVNSMRKGTMQDQVRGSKRVGGRGQYMPQLVQELDC